MRTALSICFFIFSASFVLFSKERLGFAALAKPLTQVNENVNFAHVNITKVVRRIGQDGQISYVLGWPLGGDLPTLAEDRPVIGGAFRVVRPMPDGSWAVVAEGTAVRFSGDLVEGVATSVSSTDQRAESFGLVDPQLLVEGNLFPRPMVGDYIIPIEKTIIAKSKIHPKVTFSVEELFYGEELSDVGMKKLETAMQGFANAYGRLLIEVHAERLGDRKLLKDETQQRANLLAQHIMMKTGLTRQSVIAMGFGSDRLRTGMRPTAKWSHDVGAGLDYVVLRVIPEIP